jgi:hypothetical protein
VFFSKLVQKRVNNQSIRKKYCTRVIIKPCSLPIGKPFIIKVVMDECKSKKEMTGNAPAGAVYGLGFIGAAVFFIMQATGFWMGVLGVLKAIVWPAFLVFEAFKFLAQ